jgi:pilus assembly protein Flp/PilA
LSKILYFFQDESGATAVEYALILGLMTLAIVGAIRGLGTSVSNMFDTVSTNVMDSISSATGG